MQEIESRGKTAKLWISYIRMVVVAISFIQAEGKGNIREQLNVLSQMLRYFHAAGHFHCAKYPYLYILRMSDFIANEKLRSRNAQSDEAGTHSHNSIENGYCTVRRAGEFWPGVFTDMTIVQDTMRVMKVEGGKIGRGISEGWVLAMPHTNNICTQNEQFCGVNFSSTEQHIDARIETDNEYILKIVQWFNEHDPFPHNKSLTSISTGISR